MLMEYSFVQHIPQIKMTFLIFYFFVNSYGNKQNCRCWRDTILSIKVNVWAGILENACIDSLYTEETLTQTDAEDLIQQC